jgi:hypothetical protein
MLPHPLAMIAVSGTPETHRVLPAQKLNNCNPSVTKHA